MDSKSLLCIEIKTSDSVWNRTFISEYIPSQEDMDTYYKVFCGFTDASVSVQVLPVPNDFNSQLLSVLDDIPTTFPVNDLHTKPDDVGKRAQYAQFIRQVCEMERSRMALQIFTNKPIEEETPTVSSSQYVNPSLLQKRKWVHSLLASIQPEEQCESEELVLRENDTSPIHAWIITPAFSDIRSEYGSKIILDSELGRHWEQMLGTLVFPDFVVSRRISTLSWAFQHTSSDSLLKSMLEWYVASQDATIVNGVSSWIHQADSELGTLMNTFKKIKVNERLLPSSNTDGSTNIYKLLSTIESQILSSKHEDPSVHPISASMFYKYIHYVCRALNLSRDTYERVDMVSQILQRWERGQLGFKAGAPPIISAWSNVWNVCMPVTPTVERVGHFLKTLDAWDPVEAMVFSHAQKSAIANDWIHIYIDNEIVVDTKSRIRSTNLHARVKEWVIQYIPDKVFPTYLTPMTIGPIFTLRGYNSVKGGDGRHTHGIRYKNEEFNTQEQPVEKKVRKNTKQTPKV
jgi:hypothetical protein